MRVNDNMEPEVKAYFVRIVNTLSLGLLWLVANAIPGLMFQLAFSEQAQFSTANIIFYIWFVLSTTALIWYLYKLWKLPLFTKHESKHKNKGAL